MRSPLRPVALLVVLACFVPAWSTFAGARSVAGNAAEASALRSAVEVSAIALATPEPADGAAIGRAASPFDDAAVADVDAFWTRTFAAADRPYAPPAAVRGFAEPIGTGCGGAWPAADPAFYCGLDHGIYYAEEFRDLVEERVGPFGWTTVVAHEWGHHLQALLGLYASPRATADGGRLPIQLELQADCVAGAYVRDAEGRGWADAEGVAQALRLTQAVGDIGNLPWFAPGTHGSARQRLHAFRLGHADGVAGCGIEL